MYKISAEKGINIIKCLSPARIIINSPPFVDGTAFAKEFKKDGFNVLSFGKTPLTPKNKEMIKKIWHDKQKKSVIIEGYFTELESDLFTEPYSYIYLYPNVAEDYGNNIDKILKGDEPLTESSQISDEIVKIRQYRIDKQPRKFSSESKKFISNVISQNRELYKKYCELHNDRVFTILI